MAPRPSAQRVRPPAGRTQPQRSRPAGAANGPASATPEPRRSLGGELSRTTIHDGRGQFESGALERTWAGACRLLDGSRVSLWRLERASKTLSLARLDPPAPSPTAGGPEVTMAARPLDEVFPPAARRAAVDRLVELERYLAGRGRAQTSPRRARPTDAAVPLGSPWMLESTRPPAQLVPVTTEKAALGVLLIEVAVTTPAEPSARDAGTRRTREARRIAPSTTDPERLGVAVAASVALLGVGRPPEAGELELLLELGEAARRPAGFEALSSAACTGLSRLFGAARTTVLLRDHLEDGATSVVASAASPLASRSDEEARDLAALEDLELPEVVASALRTGSPATALRPARAGRPGSWWQAFGAEAALAVPIGTEGALLVDSTRSRRFSRADVRLTRAVADHLAAARQAEQQARAQLEGRESTDALRQLLEAGVHARAPIEAASALASTAAHVLRLPVACAYLVDDAGLISEVVTVGADDARSKLLQRALAGKPASDSPVWRRTAEAHDPGPDLVDDTTRPGVVRSGGVAEVLGLRSLAAIPLLSSDGPLGMVLCGHSRPNRKWSERDRELLAALAVEGTVVVDNARLREAERHEATHDPLTGLLNRRAFSKQLREALARPRREGELAVLLLDLDRFKEVNDHLGHHRGDELLAEASRRLRTELREDDLLARLGGDEFAVCLTSGGDGPGAEFVARKIVSLLEEPFEIGELTLHVTASVGVACFPAHGDSGELLLQRADTAMYAAKRAASGCALFEPAFAEQAASKLGLHSELRRALQTGADLVLHYQPKIALASGQTTGVEALVRWRHPRHGILPPDRFIPMAEETGLVRILTSWVVPRALDQLVEWEEAGVRLRVAVNVSARDVTDRELPGKLARWVEAAGLTGDRLVVEVTESAVMSDRSLTVRALRNLRDLGIEVSLDDFGTGYSSLAYLQSLPVDELKIDRQFLAPRATRPSVVTSIVALGHDFGLRVVAEGVETADVAEFLATAGCDEAQGYFFAEPLPPAALSSWLASRPG